MSESALRPLPLPASGPAMAALADAIDAALPQTQCTRCGYPDCRAYAEAVATGRAGINQCPPGGAEGIQRLARLTGRPPLPLAPEHGVEGPRQLAVIDEAWCIGCTLCLKACPVDSILGGPKLMHTVVDADCTGCELCLPVCPVDCISLVPASGQATGWAAWSDTLAEQARRRYQIHHTRLDRDAQETRDRLAARALRPPPGLAEGEADAGPVPVHGGAVCAVGAIGAVSGEPAAPQRPATAGVPANTAHSPAAAPPLAAAHAGAQTHTSAQATDADEAQRRKRAVIEAALAKARQRRGG